MPLAGVLVVVMPHEMGSSVDMRISECFTSQYTSAIDDIHTRACFQVERLEGTIEDMKIVLRAILQTTNTGALPRGLVRSIRNDDIGERPRVGVW